MPIIVKVTVGGPEFKDLLLRQFPSRISKWGQCEFHINTNINECDWWIICHNTSLWKAEIVKCDPKKIVFASMEPYDFCHPKFYRQFFIVITCDKDLEHPCVIDQNIITWWAGIKVKFQNGHVFDPLPTHDYDSFSGMNTASKLNRISIVTSNNSSFPGHKKRLDFIAKLLDSDVGSSVDLFGGGHNPIPDKLDAIYPYKYHLALENSCIRNYWSEKIADAFLGWAMPIYYGCPNISNFFPASSIIMIDLDNPELAISHIRNALSSDAYTENLASIKVSRGLVLDQYNLFAIFSELCSSKASKKVRCKILPSKHFSKNEIRDKFISFVNKAKRSLRVLGQ